MRNEQSQAKAHGEGGGVSVDKHNLRDVLRLISDVQIDLAFAQHVREEYLPRIVRDASSRLVRACILLDEEISRLEKVMGWKEETKPCTESSDNGLPLIELPEEKARGEGDAR